MTRHRIANRQTLPASIELASQDPAFIQRQLDRSITTTLALAGFDGVVGIALESFRALIEEFIVKFLESTCASMLSSRRTLPVPHDFLFALGELHITPAALQVHVDLQVPEELSCPTISPPDLPEQSPADLKAILGTDLCEDTERWLPQVPAHFPPLPSRHAWQHTPHVAAREKDLRKLRESATQEGILAEQALRRLQAAAIKPRSRTQRQISAAEKHKKVVWEEALAAMMHVDTQTSQRTADTDVEMTNGIGGKQAHDGVASDERVAMVVNYDRAHWRKGALFGSTKN